MTQIDFHSNVADKLEYACRLSRKAWGKRARLVILAESAAQADFLNELLWTVGDTDFLPHVMAGDTLAPVTPIIITNNVDAEFPHYDTLVNLTSAVPHGLDRFKRLVEIVSTNEAELAIGRKRYTAYKQQDYPLNHYVAAQP
jgi:DNA polymerase-3 subunit chi